MNAPTFPEDPAAPLKPVPVVDRIPGREELQRIDKQVRSFVVERPVTAVLLALAAGYVVGRIISRVS